LASQDFAHPSSRMLLVGDRWRSGDGRDGGAGERATRCGSPSSSPSSRRSTSTSSSSAPGASRTCATPRARRSPPPAPPTPPPPPPPPLPAAAPAPSHTVTGKIRDGEGLGGVLRREKLRPDDTDAALRALGPVMDFKKDIKTGQKYVLQLDDGGRLVKLELRA